MAEHLIHSPESWCDGENWRNLKNNYSSDTSDVMKSYEIKLECCDVITYDSDMIFQHVSTLLSTPFKWALKPCWNSLQISPNDQCGL